MKPASLANNLSRPSAGGFVRAIDFALLALSDALGVAAFSLVVPATSAEKKGGAK